MMQPCQNNNDEKKAKRGSEGRKKKEQGVQVTVRVERNRTNLGLLFLFLLCSYQASVQSLMPLIIVCGIPCSGKTHVAKELLSFASGFRVLSSFFSLFLCPHSHFSLQHKESAKWNC